MSEPTNVDENGFRVIFREELAAYRAADAGARPGCLATIANWLFWMVIGAGTVGGLAFVMFFWTAPAEPAPAQAPPTVSAPGRNITTSGGGSGGGGSQSTSSGGDSTLPDCATIANSTTACAWRSQPPTVEQAAPTPTAEAESPSVVECWVGSFYTCEELAEMGDQRATEAIEATDRFLDTETLPTADPAFVQYATEACAAAAVKSPLCPPVTP